MMLLISMGITVAFVASWLSTVGVLPATMSFWWELALLVVIMLAGHWIEMSSVMSTSSALDSISALLPASAHIVTSHTVTTGEETTDEGTTDTTTDVSLDKLHEGDVVVVRPGEAIPADGTVVAGSAGVNESMITGESMPVTRTKGDAVVAGSISTDSSLRVRVDRIGDDTALSTIRRLVDDAQKSKTPTQLLADKAAGLLFWYALAAAIITAVVWLCLGQPNSALERVVTVLVIACPHALGLAIPLVVSIAMGGAAKRGILISNRAALETMKNLTTVVFDKTGTLTQGTPRVVATYGDERTLLLAAAAEQESEHPLGRAITARATSENSPVPAARDVTSVPGVGVSATVEGQRIEVGGASLIKERQLELPADVDIPSTNGAATRLFVVADGVIIGALDVADQIRPESTEAVAQLKARGITPVMLTGDAESVAAEVASQLGIDTYYAQVKPAEKDKVISSLQAKGQKVAMVGDGVNDAPALARADVGIAIGAGTDVAIDSADVVLTGSNPAAVANAIEISERSTRKMHQNLWWAAGYNIISVPLAAGVLAPIGFTMPMSIGAILMAVSTVIVVINARLLKHQI
jgi:Cu2+-exporting ATPase